MADGVVEVDASRQPAVGVGYEVGDDGDPGLQRRFGGGEGLAEVVHGLHDEQIRFRGRQRLDLCGVDRPDLLRAKGVLWIAKPAQRADRGRHPHGSIRGRSRLTGQFDPRAVDLGEVTLALGALQAGQGGGESIGGEDVRPSFDVGLVYGQDEVWMREIEQLQDVVSVVVAQELAELGTHRAVRNQDALP